MNESNTETTIVNVPNNCYLTGKKSMSNIDVGMHTIPSRIITKDASYSFIWIDDHLSNFKKEEVKSHDTSKKLSKRGCCNLFTILFIILMILFLFLYPFITLYFTSSSSSTTTT